MRTSSVGLEKPKCLSKQALLAFHLLKKIAFFTSKVGSIISEVYFLLLAHVQKGGCYVCNVGGGILPTLKRPADVWLATLYSVSAKFGGTASSQRSLPILAKV
jgi:hypothetical protein